MAETILTEYKNKHSDVSTPTEGNTVSYCLLTDPITRYTKDSTGRVTSKFINNKEERTANSNALKFVNSVWKNYEKVFTTIFNAATSPEQSQRLINAYNNYTSINLMVKVGNIDLAKTVVNQMLADNAITSDDKILIDKYLDLAKFSFI